MKPGGKCSASSVPQSLCLSIPLRLRRIAGVGVIDLLQRRSHHENLSYPVDHTGRRHFDERIRSANPATLPKHPGYPMDKAVDPVKGQSLANDPGQSNAIGDTALMEAAAFEDSHVMQSLSSNPNEQELRGKSNAGNTPKVQEPNMKKQQKEQR